MTQRNRLTDLQPVPETEESVFWSAGWRDCDRLHRSTWGDGFSRQMMGALREAAAGRLFNPEHQREYRRGFIAREHQQPTLDASDRSYWDALDCDDCDGFDDWL